MSNFDSYPKRDVVKNYFPLPNEIFSLGLSPGELSVYSFLMYCEERKSFQCYPSYKTIGDAVGVSKNTVKKYVDGLVQKRLIATEPTQVTVKTGQKRNGNLRYTIRPIEEAVQYHFKQQMARLEEEARKQTALRKLAEYDRKHGKTAADRSSLEQAG